MTEPTIPRFYHTHKAWKVFHGMRYTRVFGTHGVRAEAEHRASVLRRRGWLAEVVEGVAASGRPCFAVYRRRAG